LLRKETGRKWYIVWKRDPAVKKGLTEKRNTAAHCALKNGHLDKLLLSVKDDISELKRIALSIGNVDVMKHIVTMPFPGPFFQVVFFRCNG
jgi:hypothetical protein